MTIGGQDLELETLILRSMAQDVRAFDILIGRYQKRLLHYIFRMLRDPERSEDVLQNVWLDVFRQIHTLRCTRAFSTWLYRIARNHVCRELRRRHCELLTRSLEEVPEDMPSDDDRMILQEEAEWVHRGLDDLSPEHREVLILRYMEEMSYQQIAEVLGCSLGTVRSRIHYGKQALASYLEANP